MDKNYKLSVAQSKRSIKTGVRSVHFQNFLKRHGLDSKDLNLEDPNFRERLSLKVALLNEHALQTEALLEYYKSTGARGLSMYDELVNLKGQILERERTLRNDGVDPLTDRALTSAKKREFEIVKFLEGIKYDKEKTDRQAGVVQMKDADVAFEVVEDE